MYSDWFQYIQTYNKILWFVYNQIYNYILIYFYIYIHNLHVYIQILYNYLLFIILYYIVLNVNVPAEKRMQISQRVKAVSACVARWGEMSAADTKLRCVFKLSEGTNRISSWRPDNAYHYQLHTAWKTESRREIKACPDLLLLYINTWLLSVRLSCSITPLQQVPLGHTHHSFTHTLYALSPIKPHHSEILFAKYSYTSHTQYHLKKKCIVDVTYQVTSGIVWHSILMWHWKKLHNNYKIKTVGTPY